MPVIGILILALGIAAIGVICRWPMEEGLYVFLTKWEHEEYTHREDRIVYSAPKYINYGSKGLMRRSSLDLYSGRLDVTYLSRDYDAEEWHNRYKRKEKLGYDPDDPLQNPTANG